MITPFKMYLITMLNDIDVVCGIAIVLSVVALFTSVTMMYCTSAYYGQSKEEADDDIVWHIHAFAKKATKIAIKILVVTSLVGILTPTTKEMAAIIVVPKIANSETAAELGEGVKTLAVEWLEELRPKKDAKN